MEDKIIEYFEGKMSRAESADFLRCVEADKELKKLFLNTQNCYALTHLLPKKADSYFGKVAYERFMQMTRRSTIRRLAVKSLAYAAAIALLVATTWHYAGKPDTSDTPLKTTEIYTPAGQRTKLTLDDGTVVWLNARSTLAYHSDFSDNRQVVLTGEAFFEVAPNPGKPFTVATRGVNITALGTKFNVNAYPENDETQVALIEGSVKVWNDAGQEILLQPDQQVHYRNNQLTRQDEAPDEEKLLIEEQRDNTLTLQPIEHKDYFLWTNGVYSFDNEPLTQVFQKLERYYDVKIEVADASILDNEFTGKFRQQDGVDLILRMIQHISHFKIQRKGETIVITK